MLGGQTRANVVNTLNLVVEDYRERFGSDGRWKIGRELHRWTSRRNRRRRRFLSDIAIEKILINWSRRLRPVLEDSSSERFNHHYALHQWCCCHATSSVGTVRWSPTRSIWFHTDRMDREPVTDHSSASKRREERCRSITSDIITCHEVKQLRQMKCPHGSIRLSLLFTEQILHNSKLVSIAP